MHPMMRDAYARPERRTRPRAQLSIETQLYHDNGPPLMTYTVDLSPHGAFVRLTQPFPVGTPVRVALHRGPARNPLVLDAVVVRVGTPRQGHALGVGLSFQALTPIDEASIRGLMAEVGACPPARCS